LCTIAMVYLGKGNKGCAKGAKPCWDAVKGGLWVPMPDGKGKGKDAKDGKKGKMGVGIDGEEHGNVIVKNLPEGMGEVALRQLFEGYGTIEAVKCGEDKSYGFVKFTDPSEAKEAIKELHHFMAAPGKKLYVAFAFNDKGQGFAARKALEEGKGASAWVKGGKGGEKGEKGENTRLVPGSSVFVFYVPMTWEDKMLEQHFRHCGEIAKVTIMRDDQQVSKGFGFVSFFDPLSASKAIIGMNGYHTDEKRILKVGPKKGEEDFYPALPEFPPAGNIETIVPMGHPEPGATVFVFHIPNFWDEGDLHRRFIHFGDIIVVKIMKEHDGSSRGFGFVGFDIKESARRAVDGFSGFDTGEGKFLKIQIKKGEEEHNEPDLALSLKLDLAAKMSEQRKILKGAKGGGKKGKGEKNKRAGDWVCPICQDLVFATKNECGMCGTPKDMVLEGAAKDAAIEVAKDTFGPASAKGGSKDKGASAKPY